MNDCKLNVQLECNTNIALGKEHTLFCRIVRYRTSMASLFYVVFLSIISCNKTSFITLDVTTPIVRASLYASFLIHL